MRKSRSGRITTQNNVSACATDGNIPKKARDEDRCQRSVGRRGCVPRSANKERGERGEMVPRQNHFPVFLLLCVLRTFPRDHWTFRMEARWGWCEVKKQSCGLLRSWLAKSKKNKVCHYSSPWPGTRNLVRHRVKRVGTLGAPHPGSALALPNPPVAPGSGLPKPATGSPLYSRLPPEPFGFRSCRLKRTAFGIPQLFGAQRFRQLGIWSLEFRLNGIKH